MFTPVLSAGFCVFHHRSRVHSRGRAPPTTHLCKRVRRWHAQRRPAGPEGTQQVPTQGVGLCTWLSRAARNRHRHAIEQASRRWRGGRRDDSARRRRKILISTQVDARERAGRHLELRRRTGLGPSGGDPRSDVGPRDRAHRSVERHAPEGGGRRREDGRARRRTSSSPSPGTIRHPARA